MILEGCIRLIGVKWNIIKGVYQENKRKHFRQGSHRIAIKIASYGGAAMIRKRAASIDDTVILSLIKQEIAPFSKKYKDESSITMSMIQKRLLRSTTFVYAKGSHSPLGFISVLCKNRLLFVDMLAVSPRFQGRGLGRRLMQEAERFGLRKGCRSVRLFVDDSNKKAIGFYESLGYSPLQYMSEIDCYLMEKPLKVF